MKLLALAQSTSSICRSTCVQVSGDIVGTFVPALYLLRFQSDKTRLSSGVVNQALDGDDILRNIGTLAKEEEDIEFFSRGD